MHSLVRLIALASSPARLLRGALRLLARGGRWRMRRGPLSFVRLGWTKDMIGA